MPSGIVDPPTPSTTATINGLPPGTKPSGSIGRLTRSNTGIDTSPQDTRLIDNTDPITPPTTGIINGLPPIAGPPGTRIGIIKTSPPDAMPINITGRITRPGMGIIIALHPAKPTGIKLRVRGLAGTGGRCRLAGPVATEVVGRVRPIPLAGLMAIEAAGRRA